ncbi:MAG TPA: YrhA family protein [Tenuifilaceae bacterium]|nr:YrhA family protein [Tenuifilaceae bacterium]
MVTFQNIEQQLRELKGSLIANPASKGELTIVKEALAEFGIEYIPDELTDFHYHMDGFVWNGIEIYPFNPSNFNHEYSPKEFVKAVRNIVERKNCKWICFGAWDEEYFIYRVETKEYVIADRMDFMVFDTFSSLSQLLEYVIAVRS